jgi:hypothetical protein
MRLSFSRKPAELETETWAQRAEPYTGPFSAQYSRGLDLLIEAQPEHAACQGQADKFRTLARTLSIGTVVLAAIAGLTVLPDGIARWVSAIVAFCAAIVSGLTIALTPERKAAAAQLEGIRWLESRDETYRFLRWVPLATSAADVEQELGRLEARRNAILAQAARSSAGGGGAQPG